MEAEVAAFHARAEAETHAICMDGERKFAAKMKEKDDLLASFEGKHAAKSKEVSDLRAEMSAMSEERRPRLRAEPVGNRKAD